MEAVDRLKAMIVSSKISVLGANTTRPGLGCPATGNECFRSGMPMTGAGNHTGNTPVLVSGTPGRIIFKRPAGARVMTYLPAAVTKETLPTAAIICAAQETSRFWTAMLLEGL